MTSLPQLDDPTDFSSPLLQSLDSSLRCQICHELFTAPVILTNCSHTFDSLCLRNHFKLSKKCPQCQVEANEDRIRRNLVVEEMVNNWIKARPDLLALQQIQSQSQSLSLSSSTLPSPAPIASTSRSPLPPPSSTTKTLKRPLITSPRTSSKMKSEPLAPISLVEEDASSDVEVIDDPGLPSSSRKRPRRELKVKGGDAGGEDRKGKGKERGGGRVKLENPMGEASNGNATGGDPTDPSILVSCPLCLKQVKNGVISSHIDSNCKKFLTTNNSSVNTRSSSGVFGRMMGNNNSSASNGEKLNSNEEIAFPEQDVSKYLPLPNYAHKKLRDLESLLRALNLPTTVPSQYSRSTASKIEYLKRRHSQYLTIWNSNVDLGGEGWEGERERDGRRRVGAIELRRRLGEWEKVLDREERGREKDKEKEKEKGAGDKEYAKSHENDFKSLIQQARASHEKNKIKTKMTATSDESGKAVTAEAGEVKMNLDEEEEHKKSDSKVEEDGTGQVDRMVGIEMNRGGDEMTGEGIEVAEKRTSDYEPPNSNDQIQDARPLKQDSLPSRPDPDEPVSTSNPSSPSLPTPLPLTKTTSKQVRILTPPPPPISPSPLATPPPLGAGVEGRDRRDRSSSILEYDEKFFPPQSQRVREIDWEGLRRGREEAEEEEEDEERGE